MFHWDCHWGRLPYCCQAVCFTLFLIGSVSLSTVSVILTLFFDWGRLPYYCLCSILFLPGRVSLTAVSVFHTLLLAGVILYCCQCVSCCFWLGVPHSPLPACFTHCFGLRLPPLLLSVSHDVFDWKCFALHCQRVSCTVFDWGRLPYYCQCFTLFLIGSVSLTALSVFHTLFWVGSSPLLLSMLYADFDWKLRSPLSAWFRLFALFVFFVNNSVLILLFFLFLFFNLDCLPFDC